MDQFHDPYKGFIQDFRVGGGEREIKSVRKHVTRTLMTFWKFSSRKIIELHFKFNLLTTISINTVNLFIHYTISIVYIIIMITSY